VPRRLHHAVVTKVVRRNPEIVEKLKAHATSGDLGQGAIAISVRREGDMLCCDVQDDGRGLRAGHKEGLGLASTRQRLAHLYGDRHTFSLRGAPGQGVHVTMAIPFQPSEPDLTAAD